MSEARQAVAKAANDRSGFWSGGKGGDKGGEIVVAGTPEEVAEHPTSHTGRYLKQVLAQHPPVDD